MIVLAAGGGPRIPNAIGGMCFAFLPLEGVQKSIGVCGAPLLLWLQRPPVAGTSLRDALNSSKPVSQSQPHILGWNPLTFVLAI